MPLIQSNLSSALETFFSNPPETAEACARQWANAMRDYALPVVPPSTTVVAASELLATALTPIFSGSLSAPTTAIGMESAWLAFATSVGLGMAPSYVSTPPIGLVGFLGIFEGPTPTTHAEAANNFARSIHLWMVTGIAVNSGSGASTNWS